jgi:hypothetical protein
MLQKSLLPDPGMPLKMFEHFVWIIFRGDYPEIITELVERAKGDELIVIYHFQKDKNVVFYHQENDKCATCYARRLLTPSIFPRRL